MIQETIPWVHSLTLYPLWSELFHTRWHCQHFYWFQCLLQPVRGKKNRKINTSKITQFLGIGIHRKKCSHQLCVAVVNDKPSNAHTLCIMIQQRHPKGVEGCSWKIATWKRHCLITSTCTVICIDDTVVVMFTNVHNYVIWPLHFHSQDLFGNSTYCLPYIAHIFCSENFFTR